MIPTQLTIGPMQYRVVVGGAEWNEARLEVGDPDLIGYAKHNHLLITLAPDLAPGVAREVLLHEVLHACHYVVGGPLSVMNAEDPEENAVRVLTPPLLAVLRQNPALVKFLLAADKEATNA